MDDSVHTPMEDGSRRPTFVLSRNEIFREGLARLLCMDRRYSAIAIEEPSDVVFDVGREGLVVIDGTSPEAADIVFELRAGFSAARLVLLDDGFDAQRLTAGFAAGLDGYLTKDLPCDQLRAALDLIALGFRLPQEVLVRKLMSVPSLPSMVEGEGGRLSAREVEIVRHLAEGLPNKLISRNLDISDATVKVHVKAVFRKLNLSNRTQVATWAIRTGMMHREAGLRVMAA